MAIVIACSVNILTVILHWRCKNAPIRRGRVRRASRYGMWLSGMCAHIEEWSFRDNTEQYWLVLSPVLQTTFKQTTHTYDGILEEVKKGPHSTMLLH